MATGRVTFRQDRCKGCGLCVSVCPKKIIFLDENITNRKGYHPAAVKEMDQCIGCASCARMCPDSIITVERE
ncbi:MAG TPA: 4Fe-4S binding protein [Bacillota bacterium]|nr:4Fe-4S binding protein [Bacillota bacterium]